MNTEALLVYLNDLVALAPSTMGQLVSARVPAPESFIEHPNVVVNEKCEVGLLGILNGFLKSQGQPLIAIVYQDNGRVWGFQKLSPDGRRTALFQEVEKFLRDIIRTHGFHSDIAMARVFYDVVEASRHRHQWVVCLGGEGGFFRYHCGFEETQARLPLTPDEVVQATMDLEALVQRLLDEANPSLLTASDAEARP